MIEIEFKTDKKSKSYLKHFSTLHFSTTVDFILALFFTNEIKPTKQDDVVFSLIKTLGYNHIQEIPTSILKDLEKIYFDTLKEEELSLDNEKLAYLLLHKLKSGTMILMIDDKILDNLEEQVQLSSNSVISFFDQSNIQDISFKTL